MAEWHERLTRETHPAVRAEHHLRYAIAAELLATAPAWADLGSGSGVAAADALGSSPFGGHVVLVDVAEDALAEAAAGVPAADVTAVRADLSEPADLARVREAVLAAGSGPLVTCFEVIEHLATWVPAVELLLELAADHGATVVLSVPNDAFWSLENPFHQAMWGEGAFAELRRLLPAGHVVARQVPIAGSAIVLGEADVAGVPVPPVAVAGARIPSHLLAAFGPRAGELHAAAHAAAIDLTGQRRWERERESRLAHREAELVGLRAWTEQASRQLDEDRTWVLAAQAEFARLQAEGVEVRMPGS